jgi:protein-tyrosine phosphatase
LIGEGRKKGGVLVHCYAGVSRSSSFVIAYVISTFGLAYDDAKEKVKKGRPCIHPGDGFVRQLQFYAKVIANR